MLPLIEKLIAFEDSQAATFLLRVSFSAVRAIHFMRTTPLTHWLDVAVSFDSAVRGAFESINGFPLSPDAYTQVCLTPRLGGFGLRRVAVHAGGAFAASQYEAFSSWALFWGGRRPLLRACLNRKLHLLWTLQSSLTFCLLLPLLVNVNA
jgi:hypothetical protein